MTQLRIQKYISASGVASRREAERLIRAGQVSVNGRIVRELGLKIDPTKDIIKVGRKVIKAAPKGALIFYKPREVVSTMMDDRGRSCISDYLTPRYRSYFPVGRLDWDATGLIILTNDGELANHLMHPRYGFWRTYHVRAKGHPSEQKLAKLESGVKLMDGPAKAIVKFIKDEEDSTWLEVMVNEGRPHLVKRLMQKIEHPVEKLKRVRHGPFRLGKLRPGEMRVLSEAEYRKMRSKVMRGEGFRGADAASLAK